MVTQGHRIKLALPYIVLILCIQQLNYMCTRATPIMQRSPALRNLQSSCPPVYGLVDAVQGYPHGLGEVATERGVAQQRRRHGCGDGRLGAGRVQLFSHALFSSSSSSSRRGQRSFSDLPRTRRNRPILVPVPLPAGGIGGVVGHVLAGEQLRRTPGGG